MIKLKIGSKGEIVIPKKIRENLGFKEKQSLILKIKEDKIELYPEKGKEILEKWKLRALNEGVDVRRKFGYGDKLYKEGFWWFI